MRAISRRDFLRGTAAVVAASFIAAPVQASESGKVTVYMPSPSGRAD
ncbi:MAG: twin-arginine translocation signal domain-containing protein [Lachnospiraceae bacterium]|nr:twin-arginine translocation signal domain-containing protein [Lachnospiraceae bacterium]